MFLPWSKRNWSVFATHQIHHHRYMRGANCQMKDEGLRSILLMINPRNDNHKLSSLIPHQIVISFSPPSAHLAFSPINIYYGSGHEAKSIAKCCLRNCTASSKIALWKVQFMAVASELLLISERKSSRMCIVNALRVRNRANCYCEAFQG